jgi:hypothetical protein
MTSAHAHCEGAAFGVLVPRASTALRRALGLAEVDVARRVAVKPGRLSALVPDGTEYGLNPWASGTLR